MDKPTPPDPIKFPPDYIDLSRCMGKSNLDQIYLVMEYGDDYHGSQPVEAHSTEKAARQRADILRKSQSPCIECQHTYSYVVYTIPFNRFPERSEP